MSKRSRARPHPALRATFSGREKVVRRMINLATNPQPDPTRVTILGAGPAGVTAALNLARNGNAAVTVLERNAAPGGNAGSFLLEGVWCDHGSHRLHPVAEPRVLDEVRLLLGGDLLWRPRHGRILLQGRWIHFPLKPLDLLLRLPKRFTATLALDTISKRFVRRPADHDESFATVLHRGLGRTMCESFYYPYVRKLWGLAPAELAVTLAERRVSGSSVFKILKKVARQIPGLGTKTSGGFYYPRSGFGQISQSLCSSAAAHGADFVFGADVTGIVCKNGRVAGVRYQRDGQTHYQAADAVWSTLPISMMVLMIEPSAPPHVIEAAKKIRFRGMILIYLVLGQDRFSEYDAHYFPEPSIPISRMSEPKNYSASREPRNRTVLCAELPSDPDEPEWKMTDEQLGQRLCGWLAKVGLSVTAPVEKVVTRRLRCAYPVYDRSYEAQFRAIDDWLSEIPGLLTFGRQGLFAHDNTHHAMTMAFAAADCFGPNGQFDSKRWRAYRTEFQSHVVED
jgi:protoporphyrinogen oxidase